MLFRSPPLGLLDRLELIGIWKEPSERAGERLVGVLVVDPEVVLDRGVVAACGDEQYLDCFQIRAANPFEERVALTAPHQLIEASEMRGDGFVVKVVGRRPNTEIRPRSFNRHGEVVCRVICRHVTGVMSLSLAGSRRG